MEENPRTRLGNTKDHHQLSMAESQEMKGGEIMAYRRRAGGGDKAMFSRTASKTKRMNIAPKLSRGGIRL